MTSKHKGRPIRPRARGIWQRGKWWLVGGASAVVVVVLSVLATTLSGPDTSEPGIAAPDVALATQDGQLRVSDLDGQAALLYFSFPG